MKTAPEITVQLIHIEGPLKGQILEVSDPEIKIGRHPSCQLQFPADYNIISRHHATISREGNRFKLTDHSSNGTIVNGKKIKEMYLKDGDVITISEGGPKVSFLTQVGAPSSAPAKVAPAPPQSSSPPPRQEFAHPAPPQPEAGEYIPQPPPAAPQPEAKPYIPQPPPVSRPAEPAPPRESKEPLIIQYGPTLRSFDRLPLKIGKHPSCDFQLDHASILDLHAEIYFADGNYWVRDLTGKHLVTVGGVPADQGAPLRQNDELFFSPTGPFFQFLGKGRLGEVERTPAPPAEDAQEFSDRTAEKMQGKNSPKSPMSFLKKIFSKD
ncbi:MAG: FHA domain-containing protein [Proteobacteria bacterium]|nr:FHA domain-containing protein [Pseudomonadota bacterium]